MPALRAAFERKAQEFAQVLETGLLSKEKLADIPRPENLTRPRYMPSKT